MNKKFEHNIDELFGNFLDSYEDTPSTETRNKILSEIKNIPVIEKYNFFHLYKNYVLSGAAALLLTCTFIGYYFFSKTVDQKMPQRNKNMHPIVDSKENSKEINTFQPKQTQGMAKVSIVQDTILKPKSTIKKDERIHAQNSLSSMDSVNSSVTKVHTPTFVNQISPKQNLQNKFSISNEKSDNVFQIAKEKNNPIHDQNKNETLINKETEKITQPNDTVNAVVQEHLPVESSKEKLNQEVHFPIEVKQVEESEVNKSFIPVVENKLPVDTNHNPMIQDNTKTIKSSETEINKSISDIKQTVNLIQMKPWIIGISYCPEVLYGINKGSMSSNNNRSRYIHSLNASLKYNSDGFLISTGLSIAVYRKEINSLIYYKSDNSSDFRNSTLQIDTIINSSTHDTIFNSSMINVNDVSMSSSYLNNLSNQTSNLRYTYLQIPLLIGLQKEYEKIFFSVNAGGVLSFLIHKNEPTTNTSEYQMIHLENKSTLQVKSNFLMEINAGLGYHLNQWIDAALEPSFRYYMGSLNRNNEVEIKHPYSLGIKTGIYIKF